jgi:hypothetical protein
MAEIVGTIASALTLAGLFKLCIESFDVIHTLQTQGTDLQKLSFKLRIEKLSSLHLGTNPWQLIQRRNKDQSTSALILI